MTTIKGRIIFQGGSPTSIPDGSHLKIEFQDTNMCDAPAVNLGLHKRTIKSHNSGEELTYEIKTDRLPSHNLPG